MKTKIDRKEARRILNEKHGKPGKYTWNKEAGKWEKK